MLIIESLLFAVIILFPFYLISSALNTTKKKQKKLMEKAIERGNVVTAVRIKRSVFFDEGYDHTRGKYRAVYVYRVEGKKYKYVLWSIDPPREITLYYLNNPRKANIPGVINSEKINWLAICLIVAAILYCFSV